VVCQGLAGQGLALDGDANKQIHWSVRASSEMEAKRTNREAVTATTTSAKQRKLAACITIYAIEEYEAWLVCRHG
jgi:hypothetical protein